MHFEIYYFIAQFAILCNLSHVTKAKAMIGAGIKIVDENQFRYLASIQQISRLNNQVLFNHICTGTLISSKNVLTAEHCLHNELKENLQVAIGSNDFRYGVKYNILWWLTYDAWAEHKNDKYIFRNNDIAILRLNGDIHSIVPPLISNTLTLGLYDLTVTAVGWGKIENGQVFPKLKSVDLTVITNSECENRVLRFARKQYNVPLRYICTAANPPALLHYGDSGGPLLYNNQIIGISISTVPEDEYIVDPNKLNIHLVTQYYQDFISEVKNIP
ncbi:PREDICTED: chymotrypsin-2-like [Ceratosolen solmsi marchali]|uniref:Chymotrypsin-2-like n=1 Tax=Ceratosolen solmsi marchali TaxID=326594 RepID=A0AAJ6VMW4_9HYME|nr:PREDICTED: chymotrypsin-2-like [Ceratosolen solmsi marchali]